MRKTLALLLLLITGHVGAQVQKALPLGSLTAAGTLSTADLFYVQQGGTDRKATGSQIAALAGSCGLTTKADLCVFGSAPTRLSVGTNGQVLTADSAQTLGLKWATPTTYMTNPMTTAGDVIYGGASGTPTRLAGGTSGYVLTSNGATSAPSWQAASGGSSLTATYIGYGNGSNALTGTSDLTYNTGTGQLLVSKSQAGTVSYSVGNTSGGTTSSASFNACNDTPNCAGMTKYGSGYTTSGLLSAETLGIVNVGGPVLVGTTAASDIIFSTSGTGSTAERFRIINGSGGAVQMLGSTSGSVTIQPPATAGTTTITLPGATGTLATLAGSETLTNKSIAGSQLTGAYTAAGMTMATSRLLGRTTASSGAAEEISVTGGATLTGGVLTAMSNPMTTGGDIIYGGASGVPTRLANGTSGQVLTSAGGTSAPSWTTSSSVGGMVKIAKVTTSGGASTITFSSIPGTYTDLKIIFQGRDTNTGSVGYAMYMKLNSDGTAANYTSAQWLSGSSTTASAGTSAATTSGAYVADLAGKGSSNSNAITSAEITIANYAGGFYKSVRAQVTGYYGAGPTMNAEQFGFVWKNTSAITDIVLTAGGTAFENGTTATLYGLGG